MQRDSPIHSPSGVFRYWTPIRTPFERITVLASTDWINRLASHHLVDTGFYGSKACVSIGRCVHHSRSLDCHGTVPISEFVTSEVRRPTLRTVRFLLVDSRPALATLDLDSDSVLPNDDLPESPEQAADRYAIGHDRLKVLNEPTKAVGRLSLTGKTTFQFRRLQWCMNRFKTNIRAVGINAFARPCSTDIVSDFED